MNEKKSSIEKTLFLLQYEAISLKSIINASNEIYPAVPSKFVNPVFNDQISNATESSEQLRSQIAQLQLRKDSQIESLKLRKMIVDDMKPLYDAGALARNTYLEQLNSIQELEARIATLNEEEVRLLGVARNRLNSINTRIISLKAELASVDESLGYRKILAPISGRVFNLEASTSSVVTNSELLLKIVPPDQSKLQFLTATLVS